MGRRRGWGFLLADSLHSDDCRDRAAIWRPLVRVLLAPRHHHARVAGHARDQGAADRFGRCIRREVVTQGDPPAAYQVRTRDDQLGEDLDDA